MHDEPWDVRATRVLHDTVVRVEEHDVVTPDGRSFAYLLLRTRGFVKVVPVTAAGEIVFVHQYRHAFGRTTLELPAGGIDPGETPEDAARRELAEEALLRAEALEPLGVFATSPGRSDEVGHIFLATGCVPAPDAVQHEPTAPLHVPVAEAYGLIGAEVTDAMSVVALMLARPRLPGAPA
ncbi:MAG: NUDIX hydrolase [Dermatophilaceae bacterium]